MPCELTEDHTALERRQISVPQRNLEFSDIWGIKVGRAVPIPRDER